MILRLRNRFSKGKPTNLKAKSSKFSSREAKKQQKLMIDNAINQELIDLHQSGNLSFQQIAEKLNISKAKVEYQVQKFLQIGDFKVQK